MNSKNILNHIESSQSGDLLFRHPELTGLSNTSLTSLLQRLSKCLDVEEEVYLEVGVFQGLSLLSVAKSAEEVTCFGIDNFSQFDPNNRNLRLVKSRAKNIDCDNYQIINLDFEKALADLSKFIGNKKVGLFFIDGPHDYRSQLLCLEMIKPHLSRNAVIVIDDCNYLHVRQASQDFLQLNKDFALLFQSYSDRHPHLIKEGERDQWWNGVNVIVRDPDIEFSRLNVPTDPDRKIFYVDHIYMSSKMPLLIGEINNLIVSITRLNLFQMLKSTRRIWKARKSPKTGKFSSRNTYSDNLQYEKLAKKT